MIDYPQELPSTPGYNYCLPGDLSLFLLLSLSKISNLKEILLEIHYVPMPVSICSVCVFQ